MTIRDPLDPARASVRPGLFGGDKAVHVWDCGARTAPFTAVLFCRLEPGGRLVYCVCSLEPEEGEAQVEAALLRRKDLRLDPIAPGEGGSPPASLTERGTLRILPHHLPGGTDGFFAARFVALPRT